jgi:GT2 family glycosyltransferase
MNTISIVITSFNGRHLLEKHLPTVIKNSPEVKQIFVYDDAGDDDTPTWLHQKYPQIIFQRNKRNLGFTKNANLAVTSCNSDFVVLLNNDVSPDKDYLKKALNYFTDPKVFAVTFAEDQHSWPRVSWKNGKLQFTEGEDRARARYCTWPSGGSCILRKSIWKELGGFNEIYSPGYWEDIDLGWRAWKKGYKTIWDPKVIVDHQHESTFKKLDKKFVDLIKQRNELLFTWLNITDPKLISSHYRFLFRHVLLHPRYLKVVIAALRLYTQTSQVKTPKVDSKLSDQQIISSVNSSL